MAFCVVPAGSGDIGEQSNEEENANQQGEREEDMDNTDLEDSVEG